MILKGGTPIWVASSLIWIGGLMWITLRGSPPSGSSTITTSSSAASTGSAGAGAAGWFSPIRGRALPVGATRFLGAGSSISESVGRSAVLTAGFFASSFSGAGAGDFDLEAAPLAVADFEEPRAPETVPAREAREGALDAEALEAAPFGAEDLDVGTLEAMKISDVGWFPASGNGRD